MMAAVVSIRDALEAAARTPGLQIRAELRPIELMRQAQGITPGYRRDQEVIYHVAIVTAIRLTCETMRRRLGKIVPEHTLADLDLSPVDRQCIAAELDQVFGIELPDVAVEGWEAVADIAASVEASVMPGFDRKPDD